MEHKEIFAVVIAVIAVFVVIGVLSALRNKTAQDPASSQPAATTTVVIPARTTSYWDYLREQEAKSQTEATGTDVTGESTGTEATGETDVTGEPDQTGETEGTEVTGDVVVTESGSGQQEITTTATTANPAPGYTLVLP